MLEKRSFGAYYTCENIADFLVAWSIRGINDSILEPSFGDGVFIDAALKKFDELGNTKPIIHAVEIHPDTFQDKINSFNRKVTGYCQDFLTLEKPIKVNAVIGNPPYIRLRNLKEKDRSIAINSIKENIEMLTSGSLWMPFVVRSTRFLRPGGRIAFVLPYELTYVKYAYPLWDYLSKQFERITVIRVHEDFFPDVDVETVLLLADGFGQKTKFVDYKVYEQLNDLYQGNHPNIKSQISIGQIITGSKPFVTAMLTAEQNNIIRMIRELQIVSPLIHKCKFKIGYVCADKKFFHPTEKHIRQYGILEKNLINCISNAKEINGGTNIGFRIAEGQSTQKLFCPTEILDGEEQYIKKGEAEKVHKRYKCKIRKPWYVTPAVEYPDVILTVFGDIPKLVINNGNYAVSNSLLAGKILDDTPKDKLACLWYNSLTLLSIELNVHSLGGGVLVLIPGETDRLEVLNNIPNHEVQRIADLLDKCICEKGLQAAYDLGDQLVLHEIIGMSTDDLRLIKEAIGRLQHWRKPINRRK